MKQSSLRIARQIQLSTRKAIRHSRCAVAMRGFCVAPMLAGKLTVRVMAAQQNDPRRGPEQIDALIARRARVSGRRFRADAAKLFLDGEIEMPPCSDPMRMRRARAASC
jgi:hypothetical protein